MKWFRFALLMTICALSACRGGGELKCDDKDFYREATASPRVKAPEGLDELDLLKEIPLPPASPQAERGDSGSCLEHPPNVSEGG